MLSQKKQGIIRVLKKEFSSIAFSLLSGWFVTLTVFLIKESLSKKPKEALKYTTVATIKNGGVGYADHIFNEHLIMFILLIVAVAAILFCINKFLYKKTLLFALPTSFLVYGVLTIYNATGDESITPFPAFVFTILAAILLILCAKYAKEKNTPFSTNDISLRTAVIVLIIAFVAFSALWIYLLQARTANYSSHGFDMGIFAQMLDNMTESKHGFSPMVTCERGEYLSHFAVHFSPILYLLLPFAFVFNVLDVLVFAQIIVVFLGVFPLFLICRQIKFSNIKSVLISLLFLLYPAMSSGAFYDFHENAFLAPLILWTLYFSHKKGWLNTLLMFVFALLTLMVKEDAAIYVAVIALYVFFSQKQRLKGAGMLALAVFYFFFAIAMISQFGDEGTMLSSRYNNVIGKNDSFLALITTFVANPALYAAELFTADKLIYAINMLLPLAFLPLITRKASRFLLLVPFLLMNLVTDYQYQFNLQFQYSFGSGALLIYLAVINLADLSCEPRFASASDGEPQLAIEDSTQEQPEGPLVDEAEPETLSEAEPETLSEAEPGTVAETSCEAVLPKPQKHSSKQRFITNFSALALIFAIFASIFILAGRAPAQTYYIAELKKEKRQEKIRIYDETLAKIDRSKSVLSAESVFVPRLYDVEELYERNYSLQITDRDEPMEVGNKTYYYIIKILHFTEYVVVGNEANQKNSEIIHQYTHNCKYEIISQTPGVITLLRRTENSPPLGPAQ